ncbi:hypothetical protein Hanom_Chr14g01246011 [Helianthus anomalus]
MKILRVLLPDSIKKQLQENGKNRVKCHFNPRALSHFTSLVQMFHFSHVGPKRFHRCHFSALC